MDDLRLGAVCRELRRRLGWRQADLVERARVSQDLISRLERGFGGAMSVATLRAVFAALSARFDPGVFWRAGDLDRLLDEAHARIVEAAAAVYRGDGWDVLPEASYSRYGERGSIDLLSLYPDRRVAVINEIKASIASVEETHRQQDVKVRLASAVVQERVGWRPAVVGRILIVPESATIRRAVERHRTLFDASYPARSREIRAWIRDPIGPMAGIWFLSPTQEMRRTRVPGGAKRVHMARPRSG